MVFVQFRIGQQWRGQSYTPAPPSPLSPPTPPRIDLKSISLVEYNWCILELHFRVLCKVFSSNACDVDALVLILASLSRDKPVKAPVIANTALH